MHSIPQSGVVCVRSGCDGILVTYGGYAGRLEMQARRAKSKNNWVRELRMSPGLLQARGLQRVHAQYMDGGHRTEAEAEPE